MKSIDPFLDRLPSKHYNCLDFAREIWLELKGQDLFNKLQITTNRTLKVRGLRHFHCLSSPHSPCLAVFQRSRLSPHIGIYIDGRILHLSGKGVHFQPVVVAKLGFKTVKYYI